MNSSYARAETLVTAAFAPLDWTRALALIVAFSWLTALSAQVVIPLPFTPVPITGQTFAVLLTGALLGSRLGALAMMAYLAQGAAGLPFFRGGSGGAHYLLFAPTAGYLLSFPVAAYVTGLLAERGWDRRFLTAAAAISIGSLIILCAGWLWLTRFFSLAEAFYAGVAPFIAGDIIKIALAAGALPIGWKLLRGRASRQN